MISQTVCEWSEPGSSAQVDVILSSGGTGFGSRDLTPEALRPILHREAPGIAQAMLAEGLKHTPLALLSRPVAGTRNKTFIATLPGRSVSIAFIDSTAVIVRLHFDVVLLV